MEISSFGLLPLLLVLLGGGGSDLLDYLPTDLYWKQKEVVVSTELLLEEIASPAPAGGVDKLIDDLGSADAAAREAATRKLIATGSVAIDALKKESASEDVEVARRAKSLVTQIIAESKPLLIRRLMAIRTLGERKSEHAVPALRGLAWDHDPFIALYAAEAIARIDGDALPPRQPEKLSELMEQDLWLLPQGTGATGQIRLSPGLSPTFEEAVKQQKAFNPEQRKQRIESMGRIVLDLAETVGDFRIDGITFGVSSDIGDRAGSLVVIARGQFDAEAAGVASTLAGATVKRASEMDIFSQGSDGSFFFPSADRAIFFASPADGVVANGLLDKLVASVKSGRGGLAGTKDIAALVNAADRSQPLWAVAKISPEMKTWPLLASLQSLQLHGVQPRGALIEFTLDAVAKDSAAARRSIDSIKQYTDEALKGLKPIAEFMPPLRPLRDFLTSVTPGVITDGSFDVKAAMEGSLTDLFIFSEAPYTEPIAQPAIKHESGHEK